MTDLREIKLPKCKRVYAKLISLNLIRYEMGELTDKQYKKLLEIQKRFIKLKNIKYRIKKGK